MWHQRCVTIGPTICTDAKAQVLRIQQETADGRFKYDYEITPGALTRLIANINQVCTQRVGMRRPGVCECPICRCVITESINGLHLRPPSPPAMILQCSKRDPKGLFVGFHATAAGTEALEGNESPRREEVEEIG
ncbi:hypothetical protein EV401DRAFT_1163342 [Pisolithus croceorrhizus]|nr:hypothetical protein EV401DRAFT_1163342 [Pisolithus croceorrhizus]